MNCVQNVSMLCYDTNFNAKRIKVPPKNLSEKIKLNEEIDKLNEPILFEKINKAEKQEYLREKTLEGNFLQKLIQKTKNAFKDFLNDPLESQK